LTRDPFNTWQWRVLYLAISVVEGVVIAVAAKRSIPLIVALCLALAVVRLGLEAVRPDTGQSRLAQP
jgi:hypothetical protein